MSLLRKRVAPIIAGVLALVMTFSSVNVFAQQPVRQWDLTDPSLWEAFEPYFLFGNIYSTTQRMNQVNTREWYLHHFNAVTAENWHKPDAIGGRYGFAGAEFFSFGRANAIVNWALNNDIALIGHTLVWHSQSPSWLFECFETGEPLTRAEARANMELYIRTLSEHWEARGLRGAFYSWDVVNEVIASGGGRWDGDWRTQMRTNSGWYRAYSNGYDAEAGEHPSDFVYDAFVLARHYFPYSILYYNDYNEEMPAKRNAIAQMVEQLNERWAHDFENNPEAVAEGEEYTGRLLIEAIGLQSHFHLNQWATNFNNIRPTIERFAATGARLSITELDITIGTQGNPLPTPLTDAQQERQSAAFARLMGYYLEFSDYIARVSLWGKADGHSWRAWGHPLVFDNDLTAKDSFHAIMDVVAGWETPEVPAPVISAEEGLVFEGWVDVPFSMMITAEVCENLAPRRWSIVDGELPEGLRLISSTGVVGGIPAESGEFTVTVALSNFGGYDTHEFTIIVYEEA